jgi:hypothetical protein
MQALTEDSNANDDDDASSGGGKRKGKGKGKGKRASIIAMEAKKGGAGRLCE